MKDYILEAKEISFQYPDGTKALNKVNMSIEKGKKIAVLGANGAGKSTLFLHFNGINKPKAGEVYFDGKKIGYSNSELIKLRKEVGIVFQEPDQQLFSSSVMQEISFGPMNLKLDKSVVQQRVGAAMAATGIAEFKDKPTHFLSYGQKKRVAIASILSMEPSVLILDEPTAGLDPMNVDVIVNILNHLNQSGKTIIASTHDIDFAYTWADYIFVMCKGEVVGHGTTAEVFVNDELLMLASIKKPWIVEMYLDLFPSKDFNSCDLPRSKDDLLDLIKKTREL